MQLSKETTSKENDPSLLQETSAVSKVGWGRVNLRWLQNYIEVLKPRETSLLTFIGICAAIVAGSGSPPLRPFLLSLVAILLGSAGCNGLTNYLDRHVDAKMKRTWHRVLPSRRIHPPEKMLPLAWGLICIGLIVAWFLHPFCFLAGLIGTLAAVTWRKRVTCVFPQGVVAGCAPVLIGWFAISPHADIKILFLCILIGVWIPLHVWSVMTAHRDDYLEAGLNMFPIAWETRNTIKVLLVLSVFLFATSMVFYFVGHFGWLYLAAAAILGLVMVYANCRLLVTKASRDAWRVYKLSAFPYLGLLFLAMCIDFWV